ncbi:MAG: roadblock/LC7 domain-containing protein [Planctomycetes bacterium]|nr:roadblock/LC7 domain-containing protein [Planctomycetota bacterium]
MKRIIQSLKERVGVKGALIMTGDGVVAASDLGGSLDADSVAALASASVLRAMKSATELGLGRIRRLTLTAAFGRFVFVPLDELVLVVVTEPQLDLDLTLLEIAGPARQMIAMSRLDHPM